MLGGTGDGQWHARNTVRVREWHEPRRLRTGHTIRDWGEETDMTEDRGEAKWNVAEWHGKMILDRNGEKIGKLQDIYVDVETDEPQFATVKEGFIGRHLTFVPLGGVQVGPDDLRVTATEDQVRSAPDIEMHGEELSQADESTLYHHFEMNYTPPDTESGRRLARR
ncbi:MAG TPA: PRC-barrel domain-containing protein [Acidimicrobiales bacterium]|nr:PRC-barrel domain-containing protein [Acidimicrobiales bacterium]